MADHAILSPSGASRWLTCTPSARLEQQFPDKAGSAASEGTLAHSIGELMIRFKTGQFVKTEYNRLLLLLQQDKQYENAMLDYMDDYATFIVEQYAMAQAHTKDAVLMLEQKLNLTDYVPEGFGTGDAIIIADHVLDLIDLKYGKGVPVSAIENKQMMLYALGALREFDFVFNIETVRMTIYQPRLDNISIFEMSVESLRKWAQDELIPLAKKAFNGEGDFNPGDACRFCKAKATCKANAKYNLEIAKYDFQNALLLSDEDIADILDRADNFTKWIAAVEEHALSESVNNGKKWPGYKLVEGRSNRTYTDKEEILKVLTEEALYPLTKITEPVSLLPITKLEKAVNKNDFNKYVTPHIIKPPGKPVLVQESDKRPEYSTAEGAAADFAEAVNEDFL